MPQEQDSKSFFDSYNGPGEPWIRSSEKTPALPKRKTFGRNVRNSSRGSQTTRGEIGRDIFDLLATSGVCRKHADRQMVKPEPDRETDQSNYREHELSECQSQDHS